jgi:hypothetical protein
MQRLFGGLPPLRRRDEFLFIPSVFLCDFGVLRCCRMSGAARSTHLYDSWIVTMLLQLAGASVSQPFMDVCAQGWQASVKMDMH